MGMGWVYFSWFSWFGLIGSEITINSVPYGKNEKKQELTHFEYKIALYAIQMQYKK